MRYALPSSVMRLGHTAIMSKTDRPALLGITMLGMILDNIIGPDGNVGGAFIRCDNGDMPSDHHTLNVVALPSEAAPFHGIFGHAGFELEKSLDDLMAGHFQGETTGKISTNGAFKVSALRLLARSGWLYSGALDRWRPDDRRPPPKMSIVDVIKGQYGPIPHSSFNMSLPVEAVDNFVKPCPA